MKITFLIDENILGIDRFLATLDCNIIKVGDQGAPPLGSDDPIVAKCAYDNKYVVVRNDEKLVKQCRFLNVPFVSYGIEDLAKKVEEYANRSSTSDLSKGVRLKRD